MLSHKKSDTFCRTCCDSKRIPELYRNGIHRFNASRCEEMFAELGGFDSMVRSMRKSFAVALFSIYMDENNAYMDAERRATGKHFHTYEGARVDDKPTSNPNPLKASRF